MESRQDQRPRASRSGSASTNSTGRHRARKNSGVIVGKRHQYQAAHKHMSASPSVLGHIARHPDLPQEKLKELLSLQRDRIAVLELSEFLRQSAPPPNNNMCIPDLPPSTGRRKWDPLKVIRRQRRSLRHRPSQNDISPSVPAVAARTRQGNPHIAISIPKEYTCFATRPRAQPSISESAGPEPNTITKTIVTRGGSVRTYTIEKDPSDRTLSVTTTSHIGSRPRRAETLRTNIHGNVLSMPRSPPPFALPLPPNGDARSATRRSLLSQNGVVTKSVAGSTILMHPRASLPAQRLLSSSKLLPSSVTSLSLPVRTSSKHHARNKSAACDSIAEVLNADSPPTSWLQDETDRSQTPGLSPPNSPSLSGTEPILEQENTDRYTASSYSSIPILQRDNRDSCVTVVRDDISDIYPSNSSPHDTPNSDDGSFTPQTLEERRRQRRERVGNKKRKDIDAARERARQSVESVNQITLGDGPPDGYEPARRESQTLPIFEMMMSTSRSEFLPKEMFEEKPSFSPIMVVADVKPATTAKPTRPALTHARSNPILHSRYSVEPTYPDSEPESTRPSPVTINSTTDDEAKGKPTSTRRPGAPLDRTSLARRREHRWSMAEAQRLRKIAASMADPDIATAVERVSYNELARRYKMLWARHVSDLERRLGRLEADGDTWLRAVVPLLDGLNKTLGRICPEDQHCGGGEHVRKGLSALQNVVGGSVGSSIPSAPVFKREKDGEDSDEGRALMDGNLGGLNTLEPLLKHIVGSSRLSVDA